jgi:putative transposase
LTLPEGDTRYPARWEYIKKEFTKAFPAAGGNEGLTVRHLTRLS